jgi:predicted dehydrogenase
MIPTIALAGAVDAGVLRAAGWHVRGALHLTPYDDLRDVASYAGLEDLLADATLDAVALDGSDALLARHLPVLLEHGLHVLLPSPAPLDAALLQAARAVFAEGSDAPRRLVDDPGRPARSGRAPAEVAVALVQRWEPWAATVAAALPLVGTPVLQATVRGWPRGVTAAAELVDLARSWCGDVVSVCAAPAPLPADELAPGVPVAWSLLHASGATTLVSHEAAPPAARLSFATARLEAGPLGARWEGGPTIPLLPPPTGRMRPLPPERPRPAVPAGTPHGLLACAEALHEAVARGELAVERWPWPADLGDLQAVSRVLAALRESARAEAPARVA